VNPFRRVGEKQLRGGLSFPSYSGAHRERYSGKERQEKKDMLSLSRRNRRLQEVSPIGEKGSFLSRAPGLWGEKGGKRVFLLVYERKGGEGADQEEKPGTGGGKKYLSFVFGGWVEKKPRSVGMSREKRQYKECAFPFSHGRWGRIMRCFMRGKGRGGKVVLRFGERRFQCQFRVPREGKVLKGLTPAEKGTCGTCSGGGGRSNLKRVLYL